MTLPSLTIIIRPSVRTSHKWQAAPYVGIRRYYTLLKLPWRRVKYWLSVNLLCAVRTASCDASRDGWLKRTLLPLTAVSSSLTREASTNLRPWPFRDFFSSSVATWKGRCSRQGMLRPHVTFQEDWQVWLMGKWTKWVLENSLNRFHFTKMPTNLLKWWEFRFMNCSVSMTHSLMFDIGAIVPEIDRKFSGGCWRARNVSTSRSWRDWGLVLPVVLATST